MKNAFFPARGRPSLLQTVLRVHKTAQAMRTSLLAKATVMLVSAPQQLRQPDAHERQRWLRASTLGEPCTRMSLPALSVEG
jgi:hypothetical protein